MDARTLCLGALELGDASGYEIKKLYEEGDLSHFYAVGFGSIYPALTRLVEDGLAECSEQAQDKRPDKKIYRITPKGRRELIRSLRFEPGPDKIRSELCFLLLFANLLPAARIDKLIEDRIAWYREQMAEIDNCEAETPDAKRQRALPRRPRPRDLQGGGPTSWPRIRAKSLPLPRLSPARRAPRSNGALVELMVMET